jgi:hypothetical protein
MVGKIFGWKSTFSGLCGEVHTSTGRKKFDAVIEVLNFQILIVKLSVLGWQLPCLRNKIILKMLNPDLCGGKNENIAQSCQ